MCRLKESLEPAGFCSWSRPVIIACFFLKIALFLYFSTTSLANNSEIPVWIKFELEKSMSLREAAHGFNLKCKDWFEQNKVAPVEAVELSNALALGGDSYLIHEKPELAVLCRSLFAKSNLPAGSVVVLRNGAWVGDSEEEARNVPFVYIFIFLSLIEREAGNDDKPSPSEIAAGTWLPVRLTKRSAME